MTWQETPYAAALVLAALVAGGIIAVAYQSREKRGAIPLIGVLTAAFVWSLADAIRLSTTNVDLKLLMNDVRFFGPVLVTGSVFLFAAEYTNRDQWLRPRRVALVFAPHVLTLVLVWTNPLHKLVRQGFTVTRETGFVFVDLVYGPWYYVHAAYSYLLLVAAAAMLVQKLFSSGDVHTYRNQTIAILIGQFVPWAMNAAFILGLTRIDLTPLGFTVTGLLFAVALFRYRILDLVPIARSTVVDTVDEGYLVLDTTNTLVDINETATEVLDIGRNEAIGTSFTELFDDFPTIRDRLATEREVRDQIELTIDGSVRYYDIDISPIYDSRDNYTGRVVLFRDVTEQERRKQQLQHQKERLERQTAQLERQNERLEDFASIVSHDLRNPINVVSGRLELARQSPDPEHFDEMETGLKRMERIIDDVLTMARQGQTVNDPELVSLRQLAEEAWAHVDTADATLDIDTDTEIRADRGRLLQVFENLFRNSFEHGGSAVTVRVGDLSDGFFVEDDGPGIPDAETDEIFQKGYTSSDDGTGFGLAIVETAVEAHGWAVRVTEGTDGGARFEIRGIEVPPLDDTDHIVQD